MTADDKELLYACYILVVNIGIALAVLAGVIAVIVTALALLGAGFSKVKGTDEKSNNPIDTRSDVRYWNKIYAALASEDDQPGKASSSSSAAGGGSAGRDKLSGKPA